MLHLAGISATAHCDDELITHAYGKSQMDNMTINIDAIPRAIKERPQWVVWKALLNEKNDKFTKPILSKHDITKWVNPIDPNNWMTFDEAVSYWQSNANAANGIGYVFSKDDPFWGIDVDDRTKVLPQNIEARKAFEAAVAALTTYKEESPSGKGFHAIGRGPLPFDGGRVSNAIGGEIYSSLRYFTVTGQQINSYGRRQAFELCHGLIIAAVDCWTAP